MFIGDWVDMQIKTIVRIPHNLLDWPKLKRLTLPSINEDVEQLKLSYIADGSIIWYNHFGELFGNFI